MSVMDVAGIRRLSRPLRAVYWGAVRKLPARLSLSVQFYHNNGYWPDLRSPATFNEKIQWRKLNERDPLFSRMADKIAVKSIINNVLSDDVVIPTLWRGKVLTVDILRRMKLPFVLKANHTSAANLFFFSDDDIRQDRIDTAHGWLAHGRLSPHLREWMYDDIDPELLIDPFIAEDRELPVDYKFFVFDGVARYTSVHVGRATDHRQDFYDRDWNKIPCVRFYPSLDRVIAKPVSHHRMMEMAEAVAGFLKTNFVRVDFYEIGGRPFFGEATFCPGSGFEPFAPRSYDRTFGDLWTLPARVV